MRILYFIFACHFMLAMSGCSEHTNAKKSSIPSPTANSGSQSSGPTSSKNDAALLDAKRSDQANQHAAKLTTDIKDEITTLGKHEWAGEYYFGDGLGENVSLILAPQNGYLFEWHGCMGLYDRNYGSVVSHQDRLRLLFTLDNKREGFQGIAEEFFPVSWGDRKYLIPTDDVVGFCNNVNAGEEPRNRVHGSYLLRLGGEQKKVTGFPVVPTEFESYLLTKPIVSEIIRIGNSATRPSVSDWNFKDTTVVLNVGKKDGVLPGMKFHVVQPGHVSFEMVEVKTVGNDESEGVMTQFEEEPIGPHVGWKLSTRLPVMREFGE